MEKIDWDDTLVSKLSAELRDLKYENSDLKFQLELARESSQVYKSYLQSETKLRLEALERDLAMEKDKVQGLETALEESQWSAMSNNNQILAKDLEILKLQDEIKEKQNSFCGVTQEMFTRKITEFQSSIKEPNWYMERNPNGLAPLPSNYKDRVSTLPPINNNINREKILIK